MRGTTSAAAATIRAVGAGQRQDSCDHAGGLRSRVRGPHTGHRPGTLAGSRRHSRALELRRPVRTSLLVGRFQHHRPSKLAIKLRAPRVHQRTANDGHRRAPAEARTCGSFVGLLEARTGTTEVEPGAGRWESRPAIIWHLWPTEPVRPTSIEPGPESSRKVSTVQALYRVPSADRRLGAPCRFVLLVDGWARINRVCAPVTKLGGLNWLSCRVPWPYVGCGRGRACGGPGSGPAVSRHS